MKTLIFILYIFYLPFRLKLPQLPFGAVVDIFNIILLILLITSRNSRAIRPKFEIPIFVFLAIWTLSYFYVIFQHVLSWGMPMSQLTRLFKSLITLPLGYFVFARCIKTEKELQRFFAVFLICVAVIGFYTFKTGMLEGPSFADHKRGFGPFGNSWRNSDIAGAFLAMFTPFLFSYFLFTRDKILKLASAGGFIACLLGILSTYSRGSMAGVLVGCAAVVASSLKYLLKRSKIFVVLICIVACFGVLKWRYWMPQSIIMRVDETVEIGDHEKEGKEIDISDLDPGSQNRIELWKGAVELFRAHPITGVGFAQVPFQLRYDPHNGFIQIMAEMGIFGFLAFLWLLWRISKESVSLLGSEFRIISAGFIGCIISLIIVNIFYSNFFRDNVVGSFWIILGLLAASKGFAVQTKSVVPNKRNNKRRNATLFGLIAFLLLVAPSAYARVDSRWWNADDIKTLSAYNDISHTPAGTNYYVDEKNGSDDNTGNDLKHAFRTIRRAVKKLGPGDIVLIKAGVYKEGRLNISQRGTVENRIIIGPFGDGEVIIDASMNIGKWSPYKRNIYKAECPEKPIAVVINEKPLFPEFSLGDVKEGTWYYSWKEKVLYVYASNGVNPNNSEVGIIEDSTKQHAIFLNGAQYVTLYGLTIKYAGGNGVEVLGNNNRIERCDIRFNGKNGIGMFNYGNKVSDNTEIIKNHIYHNFLQNWPRGRRRWKNGGWGKGISGHGVPYNKVIGNIVHKNGGEGIGAVGEGAIIRDNIVFDNWSVNIYVCNEKNILIERNLIYCHEPNSNELYNNGDKNPKDGKNLRRLRAEGIMTADEMSPATLQNVRITNNIIIGCRRGITHYAGTKGSGMKNVLVAHNTIVVPNAKGIGEEYVGVKIPYNGRNNANTVFRNNIVYATHSSTYLLHIKTDPLNLRNPLHGLSFDHNLWYHLSKKKPFHLGSKWFRANDIDFKTWLKKVNYPQQEKRSKFADPGFASNDTFADGGLKLRANSKAIDAGLIIEGITNDYDDNPRSDGFADIGAFEFITTDKENR